MEETAVYSVALIDAVITAIGVGQNRLGTVRGNCLFHFCGDRGNGLVPGNTLEPSARSFGSNTLDRIEKAVRGVHPAEQRVDLGAQRAARKRGRVTGRHGRGTAR